MKSFQATFDSPAAQAELFADRERLSGKARERFLTVMHESLVPALSRSYGHWRMLLWLCLATPPAVVGVIRFAHGSWPPGWLTAGCLAHGLIGIALVLGYRRARRASRNDVEVNWATYCALFRPALMEVFPGLLDRNLPSDRSAEIRIEPKRATSLRELWRDRDEEFWSASLVGLGAGVLAMVLFATFVTASPIILAIPLPLSLAGLVLWIGWNRRAARR